MAEICKKCGLPTNICTCQVIAKEAERISVYTVKRRYGKITTVIENISPELNPKKLQQKLKQGLACGGTFKNGKIELQGDHRARVKEMLIKFGFPAEQIEVE
jgi:translation initiation factor 1